MLECCPLDNAYSCVSWCIIYTYLACDLFKCQFSTESNEVVTESNQEPRINAMRRDRIESSQSGNKLFEKGR